MNEQTMKVELEKILSVSGKPGIFKMLSSGKSAIVVESLVDGKRTGISPTQRISTLSDISMFTLGDDVSLRDVLLKAKEVYEGQPIPEAAGDSKTLRAAMKKILPDYDQERVYDSDIKKLLSWYNILQGKDMLEFAEPLVSEDEENAE